MSGVLVDSDELAMLRRDAQAYRWIRDLECNSVTISFNEHAANYITAEQQIAYEPEWFSEDSPESIAAMKAANSIWTVQIYPHTPVGFNAYNGATLDDAIRLAMADK